MTSRNYNKKHKNILIRYRVIRRSWTTSFHFGVTPKLKSVPVRVLSKSVQDKGVFNFEDYNLIIDWRLFNRLRRKNSKKKKLKNRKGRSGTRLFSDPTLCSVPQHNPFERQDRLARIYLKRSSPALVHYRPVAVMGVHISNRRRRRWYTSRYYVHAGLRPVARKIFAGGHVHARPCTTAESVYRRGEVGYWLTTCHCFSALTRSVLFLSAPFFFSIDVYKYFPLICSLLGSSTAKVDVHYLQLFVVFILLLRENINYFLWL